MANEINELQAIRNVVAGLAQKIEGLAQSHRKTQARLLSVEATLASTVGSLTKTPAKDVFASLRRQTDHLLTRDQSERSTAEDLAAIEYLLKSLQSGNVGKA